jgi:hypothetical protein
MMWSGTSQDAESQNLAGQWALQLIPIDPNPRTVKQLR